MYAPAPRRSSTSNATPCPITSSPRSPCAPGLGDRVRERVLGLRVLPAEIDEAALAARREPCDRHRLEHGERVALQELPVLERAGLGLVGVADEVVRPRGLPGDGLPLDAGRERRAAAADEPRVLHLAQHPLGAELERPAEGRVAAVGAVVVEARRVDHADAAQETERRVAPACGTPGPGRGAGAPPASRASTSSALVGACARSSGGSPATATSAAGARSHWPRHGLRYQVAEPSSESSPSGPNRSSSSGDQLERPTAPARDVLADVHDARRTRLEGEERVEGRDPVGVGGRHGQPAAELVEAAGADPADPLLQRPERGQQEMAASPGRVPSGGGVARDAVGARAAVPAGGRRAEDGVESGSLGRRGLGERDELQVHATGGADRLIAEGSIGTGRRAAVHGRGRK